MLPSYGIPIHPRDLLAIAAALRARDVFTPTFLAPEVDLYDPAVYLHEAHVFSTSTFLLVDRNILSRLVALVRGAMPSPEHRLAAGVLAFAQCAGISVEPNIALYELARSDDPLNASGELKAFRLADRVHPAHWAQIALGQEDVLRELPEAIPASENDLSVDFSMQLTRYRRNYILSLKIAELELEGGSPVERMSRLISWMYLDFLFGGPAIALAAHRLAPNASRKRLFKGLRSLDRENAIAGIRNAAWDLTMVSEWLLNVANQERDVRLTLLTTFDRGLHRLARSAADIEGVARDRQDHLRRALVGLWGIRSGERLADQLAQCYASHDNPKRQINRPVGPDFVTTCIETGEAAVRGWKPGAGDNTRWIR